MKKYTVDTKGKSLGRAASEAAAILCGKNMVDFARNIAPNVIVEIINASEVKITGKKIDQKGYKRFSGYPGGLKIMKMGEAIEKKGNKYIFEKAVMGMLPKNKLRKIMIKNLIVK